ncbi:hypothetical protein WICPIJ_008842 [Wickerhamomyces pijperi]|uniref:CBS domain-containing protein n=1 Tax=Wickerhamomyces pijperi TaxID=599730 RepID=A0A9P8PUF1_WICPI|nr:hypothetical protein WICPIJ_008842 [Wickerhamomyces pijperi]
MSSDHNSIRRKGAIVSLNPDTPLYCSLNDSIRDVANLMAKKSLHCVLVEDTNVSLDSNSTIKGLITTKDIGLRVVGKGLDSNITRAKDIMTQTPTILYMDTPITEALSVMVDKNIRHLPLKDYNESILGVIDITKCFYQAMLRLDRVSVNAKKLTSLLKDVESEFKEKHTKDAERIVKDVENLQQVIQIPTLAKIFKFGKHSPVIYVSSTSSVYDAAKLMAKNHITALLVKDGTKGNEKVIGIFTSKDICSRVIAKGYDPRTCTVAKVLTPKPEFASSDFNIASSLKLMYKGNFLNLPVIDLQHETQEIIGVVSVLQLIYEMLSELGKLEHFDKSSYDTKTLDEINLRTKSSSSMFTPVWDRFWSSLEKSTEDIQLFETSVIKSPGHSRSQTPRLPRSTSSSTAHLNSRKASLNQMILSNSNSRKSSSFTVRRHSDNFSDTGSRTSNMNTLKPSNFKRILSQESLSRTRFYIHRKTIVFKVRLKDSLRVHKISMIINEGVDETDDLKLLDLLKLEIYSKLNLLPDKNKEQEQLQAESLLDQYHFFYYDPDHNLAPLNTEFDLMKAIKLSDFEDLHHVELMIANCSDTSQEVREDAGNQLSFWGKLWNCLSDNLGKFSTSIHEFVYNPNSSFITLAFASLGFLMGFTLIVGIKRY